MIQIYNSMSRKLELFEPLNPPFVSIYVCGPTVYGPAHLGHAKSYVSFDVIVRYLRYKGYKVKYVQNITDVGHLTDDADEGEDKIQKKARLEKLDPMQVVELYIQSYLEDMDSLNVLRADIYPRASGHIIEQIEIIEDLIQKGYAYEVNGSVYFEVSRFPDYGKLSGRILDESLSGTRIDKISDKRHSHDFALWKKADESHLMKWRSPWGYGYPGWHIECSAMSMKYLGLSIDIHGGGMENKFPHHECEIAQSEAHTDKTFVKYWMHNNMVTRDGVKMGKSLGNSISLREATEQYGAMAVRYFVLNSHYRSNLDFSDHALSSAQKALYRLENSLSELKYRVENHSTDEGQELPFNLTEFQSKIFQSFDQDFATPEVLAELFNFSNKLNSLGNQVYSKSKLYEAQQFFELVFYEILGFIKEKSQNQKIDSIEILMGLILKIRNQAKLSKNYLLSDDIRDYLQVNGFEIRDAKDGTKWIYKNKG